MKRKHQSGQAMLEYLFVFIIMVTIGLFMAKGMTAYFGSTLTSLSAILTKELSVGVCASDCLTDAYKNRSE